MHSEVRAFCCVRAAWEQHCGRSGSGQLQRFPPACLCRYTGLTYECAQTRGVMHMWPTKGHQGMPVRHKE